MQIVLIKNRGLLVVYVKACKWSEHFVYSFIIGKLIFSINFTQLTFTLVQQSLRYWSFYVGPILKQEELEIENRNWRSLKHSGNDLFGLHHFSSLTSLLPMGWKYQSRTLDFNNRICDTFKLKWTLHEIWDMKNAEHSMHFSVLVDCP